MPNREQRREDSRINRPEKKPQKEKTPKEKKPKKVKEPASKKELILTVIVTAIICAIIWIVVVEVPKWKAQKKQDEYIQMTMDNTDTIFIPTDSLQQSQVTYFDYDIEGGPIQFIMTLDENSEPRVALNTSEHCKGDAYSYWVQVNEKRMVCQACGSEIDVVTMGDGGNPNEECYPYLIGYMTMDGYVLLNKEELLSHMDLFENWKKDVDTSVLRYEGSPLIDNPVPELDGYYYDEEMGFYRIDEDNVIHFLYEDQMEEAGHDHDHEEDGNHIHGEDGSIIYLDGSSDYTTPEEYMEQNGLNAPSGPINPIDSIPGVSKSGNNGLTGN